MVQLQAVLGHVGFIGWIAICTWWASSRNWEHWIVTCLASTIFHAIVNVLTPSLTRMVWKGFDSLAVIPEKKLDDKDTWTNTVVSLVHAVLCCVTSFIPLWRYREVAFSWNDVRIYQPTPDDAFRTSFAITMGYLWVDCWDAAKTGLFVRKIKTVVSHHVLMYYGLWWVCENRWGESLLVFGVICELNSGFLHLRKLCSLAGMGLQHSFYSLLYPLIAISFLTTRYAAHLYVCIHSLYDTTFFIELGIPRVWQYANAGAFAFLTLFNYGLHMQVQHGTFAKDVKRYEELKAKRKD